MQVHNSYLTDPNNDDDDDDDDDVDDNDDLMSISCILQISQAMDKYELNKKTSL